MRPSPPCQLPNGRVKPLDDRAVNGHVVSAQLPSRPPMSAAAGDACAPKAPPDEPQLMLAALFVGLAVSTSRLGFRPGPCPRILALLSTAVPNTVYRAQRHRAWSSGSQGGSTMPLRGISKVAQICVALTMVAAPAVLLASPASATTTFVSVASIGLQDPSTTATDPATASLYPSTISVSGQTGSISDLTVTLSGITYPDPQALSMLLVGPEGGNLMLLSGAGGTTSVSGLTVTLSDGGGSMLPENSAPVSNGTYRPSDYGTGTFPSPAPSGPYEEPAAQGSATLGSTFGGTNPNGTWSLDVTTDVAGSGSNTGSISGVEPRTSTRIPAPLSPRGRRRPSPKAARPSLWAPGSP